MAQASGSPSVGRMVLVPLALLCVFLLVDRTGAMPAAVTEEIVRWSATGAFALCAVMFAASRAAIWCGLCAAMAVVLNPLYPLPLGDLMASAKMLGAVIAGAAVVRHW